jgi:hypothetical protein
MMSMTHVLRGVLVAVCMTIAAGPAMAQNLPDLRDARDLVFAEDGAVQWEVIPHDSLSAADLATLDALNQIQPQPYYAAFALATENGLAAATTVAAVNFHDEDSARASALAACVAAGGVDCTVVLIVRPQGWEPGRSLQLNAEATAALRGDFRRIGRDRVLAISPATGQWGMGDGRDAALAACGADDCIAVVEG